MAFADWPAYRALMASERACHMGGPFPEQAAWGMFCADHAQWDLFGAGALMIEDRTSGACLGQVGINSGPLFPEPELGWFLYPGAEGRGIAFEAASALRDWARSGAKSGAGHGSPDGAQAAGGMATLVSYIAPANHRSRRLAERMGAWLDAEAPRQDRDDLVFRHFGRFAG